MIEMTNSDNEKLHQLGTAIEGLGYAVELLHKSEELPVDMLSIPLEDDTKHRPQVLTLTVYPLDDEMDASHFVQCYFQYPFEIRAEHRPQVLEALAAANRELPLGHFNTLPDANGVYFKYVLALPRNGDIGELFLNDVLDMCLYAQEHYLDPFEALA